MLIINYQRFEWTDRRSVRGLDAKATANFGMRFSSCAPYGWCYPLPQFCFEQKDKKDEWV